MILGVAVFAAGFIIPETIGKDRELDEKTIKIGEEKIKEILEEQMKEANDRLKDSADEILSRALEKTERSLEKISNEKITAVSEFSDTVLEDIHKSHQEVIFLYDMLHDKQKNLQETAKAVDRTSAIAKETKNELENVVQEAANAESQEAPAPQKALAAFAAVLESVPDDDNGQEESYVEEAKEEGNKNDIILEMHRQGKSNVAIAKELGLGVGEVNLVIDLFEVI